jgi:O-acetyl-ADP-ribose deacetylase (regulator of RNase III)
VDLACTIAVREVGRFLANDTTISQVAFACFSESMEQEMRMALDIFKKNTAVEEK